jgi:hypothetical protein
VGCDHIVILPEAVRVRADDFEAEDNPLEVFLREVEARQEEEAVMLLLRPGSAVLSRKLRDIIRSRGIDVEHDLLGADEVIRLHIPQ